jgi:hypothetical protein
MNCNEYKVLIGKFIEGTIGKVQLDVLRQHSQDCQQCREEFQVASNLSSVLKQSLCPEVPLDKAVDKVLSGVKFSKHRLSNKSLFSLGKWAAVAACILIGFGLAKIGDIKQAGSLAQIKVPMKATEINGTVLVRHSNSDLWQSLTPDSQVYLGDTFHSTAKSGFVLVLSDGSTMALAQNSMLELKEYNGQTDFYLTYGEVDSDLRSPHSPFFISTPHGRVEALGTDFTVSVD